MAGLGRAVPRAGRRQSAICRLLRPAASRRVNINAAVRIDLVQLDQGEPAQAAQTPARVLEEADRLEARITPARVGALFGLGRIHLAPGDSARALLLIEQTQAFWRGFDPQIPWARDALKAQASAKAPPNLSRAVDIGR